MEASSSGHEEVAVIFALEGPDRCGKTTVFELLRDKLPEACFVPPIPLPSQLMPVMSYVEQRQAFIWEALYDPKRIYVCDRHFTVSSYVYDSLFGRPHSVDLTPWIPRVRMIYFLCPVQELKRRHLETGDPHFPISKYEQATELYWKASQEVFNGTVIDATQTAQRSVRLIVEYIRRTCGKAKE
jgi:thymidylate kinase